VSGRGNARIMYDRLYLYTGVSWLCVSGWLLIYYVDPPEYTGNLVYCSPTDI